MPTTRGKSGGNFIPIQEAADLAIPFGLVLAERSLSKMFGKQTKKPTSARQRGGSDQNQKEHDHAACALCDKEKTMFGGKPLRARNDAKTKAIRQELAVLANQLEKFLTNSS